MSHNRMFDLRYIVPGFLSPEHKQSMQVFKQPVPLIRWLSAEEADKLSISTRVRVFDEKSYLWVKVLIRERTFGVSRKYFFFRDLTTGVKYELDSSEVRDAVGARRVSQTYQRTWRNV